MATSSSFTIRMPPSKDRENEDTIKDDTEEMQEEEPPQPDEAPPSLEVTGDPAEVRWRSRRRVAPVNGNATATVHPSNGGNKDANSLEYWRRVRSLSRENRQRQEARDRHMKRSELEERRRRERILAERKKEKDALMMRFLREPLRMCRPYRVHAVNERDIPPKGRIKTNEETKERDGEEETDSSLRSSQSVPDLEEALRIVRGEDQALDARARAFLSPNIRRRHNKEDKRQPLQDEKICDRYLRTHNPRIPPHPSPPLQMPSKRRIPVPPTRPFPPGSSDDVIRENQKPYPTRPPEELVGKSRNRQRRSIGENSLKMGTTKVLSDTFSVTSEPRDIESVLASYKPPMESHIMVLPKPRLDRRSSMPDLRDFRCVSSAVVYETIATLNSLGDARGLMVLPPRENSSEVSSSAMSTPEILPTNQLSYESPQKSPQRWAQKMDRYIQEETQAVLSCNPLIGSLSPALNQSGSQKVRRTQRKEWVSKHTSIKSLQKKILPTFTDSSSQTERTENIRPVSAVLHRRNSLGSEGAESVYYDSLEEDESRNSNQRSSQPFNTQAFYVPMKNNAPSRKAAAPTLPARLSARLEERRTSIRRRPLPNSVSENNLSLTGKRVQVLTDEEILAQIAAKEKEVNDNSSVSLDVTKGDDKLVSSDSDILDSPKVIETISNGPISAHSPELNTDSSHSEIIQITSPRISQKGSHSTFLNLSINDAKPHITEIQRETSETKSEAHLESVSTQNSHTYTPFSEQSSSTPSSTEPSNNDLDKETLVEMTVSKTYEYSQTSIVTEQSQISIKEKTTEVTGSDANEITTRSSDYSKDNWEEVSNLDVGEKPFVKEECKNVSDLPFSNNVSEVDEGEQDSKSSIIAEGDTTDSEQIEGKYDTDSFQSMSNTYDKSEDDISEVIDTLVSDGMLNNESNSEVEVQIDTSMLDSNDILSESDDISENVMSENNDVSDHFPHNSSDEIVDETNSNHTPDQLEIVGYTSNGKETLLESGFIDCDDASLTPDPLNISCDKIRLPNACESNDEIENEVGRDTGKDDSMVPEESRLTDSGNEKETMNTGESSPTSDSNYSSGGTSENENETMINGNSDALENVDLGSVSGDTRVEENEVECNEPNDENYLQNESELKRSNELDDEHILDIDPINDNTHSENVHESLSTDDSLTNELMTENTVPSLYENAEDMETEELSDETDSWDRITVVRAPSCESNTGSRNATPDMEADISFQAEGEELKDDNLNNDSPINDLAVLNNTDKQEGGSTDLLQEIFRNLTPNEGEQTPVDESSSGLSTIEEDDEAIEVTPLEDEDEEEKTLVEDFPEKENDCTMDNGSDERCGEKDQSILAEDTDDVLVDGSANPDTKNTVNCLEGIKSAGTKTGGDDLPEEIESDISEETRDALVKEIKSEVLEENGNALVEETESGVLDENRETLVEGDSSVFEESGNALVEGSETEVTVERDKLLSKDMEAQKEDDVLSEENEDDRAEKNMNNLVEENRIEREEEFEDSLVEEAIIEEIEEVNSLEEGIEIYKEKEYKDIEVKGNQNDKLEECENHIAGKSGTDAVKENYDILVTEKKIDERDPDDIIEERIAIDVAEENGDLFVKLNESDKMEDTDDALVERNESEVEENEVVIPEISESEKVDGDETVRKAEDALLEEAGVEEEKMNVETDTREDDKETSMKGIETELKEENNLVEGTYTDTVFVSGENELNSEIRSHEPDEEGEKRENVSDDNKNLLEIDDSKDNQEHGTTEENHTKLVEDDNEMMVIDDDDASHEEQATLHMNSVDDNNVECNGESRDNTDDNEGCEHGAGEEEGEITEQILQIQDSGDENLDIKDTLAMDNDTKAVENVSDDKTEVSEEGKVEHDDNSVVEDILEANEFSILKDADDEKENGDTVIESTFETEEYDSKDLERLMTDENADVMIAPITEIDEGMLIASQEVNVHAVCDADEDTENDADLDQTEESTSECGMGVEDITTIETEECVSESSIDVVNEESIITEDWIGIEGDLNAQMRATENLLIEDDNEEEVDERIEEEEESESSSVITCKKDEHHARDSSLQNNADDSDKKTENCIISPTEKNEELNGITSHSAEISNDVAEMTDVSITEAIVITDSKERDEQEANDVMKDLYDAKENEEKMMIAECSSFESKEDDTNIITESVDSEEHNEQYSMNSTLSILKEETIGHEESLLSKERINLRRLSTLHTTDPDKDTEDVEYPMSERKYLLENTLEEFTSYNDGKSNNDSKEKVVVDNSMNGFHISESEISDLTMISDDTQDNTEPIVNADYEELLDQVEGMIEKKVFIGHHKISRNFNSGQMMATPYSLKDSEIFTAKDSQTSHQNENIDNELAEGIFQDMLSDKDKTHENINSSCPLNQANSRCDNSFDDVQVSGPFPEGEVASSSDDSPREGSNEEGVAANSPSSDSGVVEMAGKATHSPLEGSREEGATGSQSCRESNSQESSQNEVSTGSLHDRQTQTKQAKDKANRITSARCRPVSACDHDTETKESVIVKGWTSLQDSREEIAVNEKIQRCHRGTTHEDFLHYPLQIDSDTTSRSKHQLVQDYLDNLPHHHNSKDESPNGTAGSPPRSINDMQTDNLSDFGSSESGEGSYSERLLKALEARRMRRHRPPSSNIDHDESPGKYRPSTLSALDAFLATLSRYRGGQEGDEDSREETPSPLLPGGDDVTVHVRAGLRHHDVKVTSRRQVRLVVNISNPGAASDSGCVPDTTSHSEHTRTTRRKAPVNEDSPRSHHQRLHHGKEGRPTAPTRGRSTAVDEEVDQLLTDVREYLNKKLNRNGNTETPTAEVDSGGIFVEGSNIEKCFKERPPVGNRTKLYPKHRSKPEDHHRWSRQHSPPPNPIVKEQQKIQSSIRAINSLLKQFS